MIEKRSNCVYECIPFVNKKQKKKKNTGKHNIFHRVLEIFYLK